MIRRKQRMKNKYDFGGWATKYNLACSDGRTISNGAFKHCDEIVVPLVWNHNYTGPESIIGNATLKHMDEGVYAYGKFNDSDTAQTAKGLVMHGDITSLSIYANRLQQKGGYVLHGDIKEVSLVLAGANPGASIQEVLVHGDADDTQATIYNDPDGLELFHGDIEEDSKESEQEEEMTHADAEGETVADVYSTLTDKQKKAVAAIFEQLADGEEENNKEDNEGEPNMKHNVFEQGKKEDELVHMDFGAIVKDGKKCGSFKEAVLSHAEQYGIKDIEMLFPEAHNLTNEPGFIDRDQSWVKAFFDATKKSPFSRIKSVLADITADEARARGYVKGNLKKEEVIKLLKRTTSPTTIYKKQKLDRDDVIDITDFDVVSWLKREMRGKLEEEIARAILVGDGRTSLDESKVKEDCIRPIYNDSDLYTIKAAMGAGEEAKEFIKTSIKARADFEGTGMPNLYITGEMLAELLLIEDNNGRFIYPDVATLAKTLRVKEIVEVPVMKNLVRTDSKSKKWDVKGIYVNPNDYTVGADKGGQVAMFDDFDIDYNQMKYLIETRCSGSLVIPRSALVIEKAQA